MENNLFETDFFDITFNLKVFSFQETQQPATLF